MNENGRIAKYDFIRAFAIITVVASHVFTMFDNSSVEFEIKEYINTILRFSVPLFLFLSGVLFRKNADFGYLKKKFLRILVPYTIVSIPATIFLCWKYNWNWGNLPEIILSYLFGYKFGFYFIFLILMLYVIGYIFVKTKVVQKINILLLSTFVLQFTWLAIDEFVYRKYGLNEIKFFQFQVNDLIFYLNPLTWTFFFTLGLWYQEWKSKELIKKNAVIVTATLILSFLLYNLRIFFKFGDYTPYGSIIWSAFSTSITLFLLNLNVKKWKNSKVLEYLSGRSFSVFLIHYFFIYLLVEIQRLTDINFTYAMTLIFFPLIFVMALLITELVKKVAGEKSKWMIGS